jgi:intein-encoded DNA endonuclease-like protein
MKGLPLTETEKSNIVNYYNLGYYPSQIGKLMKRSDTTIVREFRNNNFVVPKREESRKLYKINSNYFKTINTENKAYFLGLLYADGNVYKNQLSLYLTNNDVNILELFLKDMESSHRLYRKKTYSEKHNFQLGISICDAVLCEDLKRLGCVSCKSPVLTFPTLEQVPEEFQSHFIRGYFDGDGCLSIVKRNNRLTNQFIWRIIGTHSFCNSVRNIFYTECGINKDIKLLLEKRSKNPYYYLQYGGVNQIKSIEIFMYKNANVFLKRKFKNISKEVTNGL